MERGVWQGPTVEFGKRGSIRPLSSKASWQEAALDEKRPLRAHLIELIVDGTKMLRDALLVVVLVGLALEAVLMAYGATKASEELRREAERQRRKRRADGDD